MTDRICVLPDAEAVGLQAALLFARHSGSAIASRGRFTTALSGGSTPLRFFEILSTLKSKDIRWDKTAIFWVDERCVPQDDPDSNYRGFHDALLSRTDIPAAVIHRIRGEVPPEAGAMEYEEELRIFFDESGLPSFDLLILGVGEDGHTASLFPDASSLTERKRWALPVYAEKLRSWRITLTLPVLNNAAHILFLVTGRKKADILREILGSRENRGKYPAGLVRPLHGEVTWLIDSEAASFLKNDIGNHPCTE